MTVNISSVAHETATDSSQCYSSEPFLFLKHHINQLDINKYKSHKEVGSK